MKIFLKNFFSYKLWISRSGVLLFLIGIFLAIISFVKGIQILMFIPAFVLSIFLYAIIEYFFIDIHYYFSFGKRGNSIKLFTKKHQKYNFILANEDENGIIEFLPIQSDQSYDLETEKKYRLYLYAFGRFDIIRKRFLLGEVYLPKYGKNDVYTLGERYQHGDIFEKLDTLKTSLHNFPYIKKGSLVQNYSHDGKKIFLESHQKLTIKGYESLDYFHLALLFLATIGFLIEWQDVFFTLYISVSFLGVFFLKRKGIMLSKKQEKYTMIGVFILMILLSVVYRDMSGTGSVFLIQLLLITLLTPKGKKNSFLFLFLILFVFVAISLYSSQIRFIFLFLGYLILSTYLLFFISGDETFETNKYKIGSKIQKKDFLFTVIGIIISLIVFYFLLPHGYNKNDQGLGGNNHDINAGFQEEVLLENIKNISENNQKIFIIEDISEKEIETLGLKYFRGMRYEQFYDNKWHSKYKDTYIDFQKPTFDKKTFPLKITYHKTVGKNLFIPATPIEMYSEENISFVSVLQDKTLIKSRKNISEKSGVFFKFPLDEKGKMIDVLDKINKYNHTLTPETIQQFIKFFDTIPEEMTLSPQRLTNFIKFRAGFSYSTQHPAVDIQDFLYHTKAGHCEYFATVLAVTLQYYGYPATLVNGYVNGEYNELAKSLVVRGKNAHAWVEVYNSEKKIWEIYDPTPPEYTFLESTYQLYIKPIRDFYDYLEIKWYTYVVNYTREEQQKLFVFLLSHIYIFILGCFLLVILIFSGRKVGELYYFLTRNKKEKMIYILSIVLKEPYFCLQKFSTFDQKLAKEYEEFLYGNSNKKTYFSFLGDIWRIYQNRK